MLGEKGGRDVETMIRHQSNPPIATTTPMYTAPDGADQLHLLCTIENLLDTPLHLA